ncbi:aminopeptidase P N-terminal domain-containing protein [Eudoraea chungangensis]|uniref:aminopeptidase P N-terminal domain-containing protein n=1 Tax=Eudoraea chungangensis TaxID=1481905 RepID=UPI0023EDD9FB|nr:aminopeptidase P N-terminal domain-containing protein [Eudoraea chungangensis]
MKYDQIDKALFIKNRKKFMARMKPKSIAVFNSNDIYPISADSTMPFKQHSDILYLSGIDQEESILLLFPDALDKKYRQVLFVRETNAHIAVWEGAKLDKEQARSVSGIETVYWLSDFDKIFFSLMTESEVIYFNTNEHYRQAVETQTREDRFIIKTKDEFPGHQVAKSNPILQEIRGEKEKEEIDLIKRACEITEKGFRRILGFTKPGIWEYELEAEFLHEFIINRSKGFAYTPIIASGNNANVLHYIENNKQCKNGDLILMDVGAEYANYCSDMTRTIPVNGRFSERQRQVYEAVLKVKNEATQMLIPGASWTEYHEEVGKLMTSALIDLKLLKKSDVDNESKDWPAYKKYFMHGTSHHLGLDTHDYGPIKTPMKANMVFTVEPGIYLPEEGFGIRLEDDVVITSNGDPVNLMENIPIEVDEIESLMNG